MTIAEPILNGSIEATGEGPGTATPTPVDNTDLGTGGGANAAGSGGESGSGDDNGSTATATATTDDAGNAAQVVVAPAEPTAPKGFMRRIDELTRQKGERDRLLAERDAEIILLRTAVEARGGTANPSGAAASTQSTVVPPGYVLQSEVDRRAGELAAATRFNEMSNGIAEKGRSAHTDFNTSVDTMRSLGMTPQFVEALAAAAGSDAHEVLYELGKDADRAVELLGMAPLAQAATLARMADKIGGTRATVATTRTAAVVAEPAITDARRPVPTVVGGRVRAEPTLDNDNLSDADWFALREKDVQAKRANNRNYQL